MVIRTSFVLILLFVSTTLAQTSLGACGCEDKPLPEVLATVNGQKVGRDDLSEPTRKRISNLQQQIIDARTAELDKQINALLMRAEAKKRGITPIQLMEVEVGNKVPLPTSAQARSFYDQNRAQLNGDFESQEDRILDFLYDQKEQELLNKFAHGLRGTASIKVHVPVPTPPASATDRARVFAVVNGKGITSADIENGLQPLIFSVQEQMYDLRRYDLNLKINDLLLTEAAKKQGITPAQLVEREVTAELPVIGEEAARKFFEENKRRINGEFPAVKHQIIEYLNDQEREKRTAAFAEQLQREASVQIFLTPPDPPVYDIAIDDQPIKGDPNAPVTLVEFTDFQCPSCARQHPILERILKEFGDSVRLVVRDFPLSQHKEAAKAAEAAEAAREQGKYWEYVALLYTRQSALQLEKLKEYATELGLDREKFDASLDGGKHLERVHRDLMDGESVGIEGTPTLFLNGRVVSDRSYEGLKSAIEKALKKRL